MKVYGGAKRREDEKEKKNEYKKSKQYAAPQQFSAVVIISTLIASLKLSSHDADGNCTMKSTQTTRQCGPDSH